jgi:hypothetical protein
LIVFDGSLKVGTGAHGDPEDCEALALRGVEQRRQLLIGDELGREVVRADEQDGDPGRVERVLDLTPPLIPVPILVSSQT